MTPIDTDQIHSVISWNDATITGVLIAFVIAFGSVIYYLFKVNQDLYKTNSLEREKLYQEFTAERDKLYKEHVTEIKSFNELLMKINNQYYDAIRNLVDFNKK
jgi:hypothetical protein